MKKGIALLLALAMCLSLCACGGAAASKETVAKLALGETASTDITEFTLEDAEFAYYLHNTVDNDYLKATDTSDSRNPYVAKVGTCYVSVTFTLTNKDRGGYLDYPGESEWTVSYKDIDYSMGRIDFSSSAILDIDTGKLIDNYQMRNYLLDAGRTVTFRAFGVINVDPENLTDAFDFTVSILNSSGEPEYFTYSVPARA